MADDQASFGEMIEDPALTLAHGSQIKFAHVLMPHAPPAAAVRIIDWEFLNGLVLAMAFTDDRSQWLDGSAVVVAPGIALCAKHVVENHLEQFCSGTESITCFGVTKNGLQIWRVKKITTVARSDLAILGLTLASSLKPDVPFSLSAITTRLPTLGDRVTVFGFRSTEGEPSARDPSQLVSKFAANVLVCTGEVVERYPQQVDAFLMPWPSIQIDCPTWGGMSGGPVFDSTGKVIGLLSGSLTTEDNRGPSFASLLFPALTAQFEGGWPEGLFKSPTSLLEMDTRICKIDRRDAVAKVEDEKSGEFFTRYTPCEWNA